VLFLVAHPLKNLFATPGIDIGFFADMRMESKTLGFQ